MEKNTRIACIRSAAREIVRIPELIRQKSSFINSISQLHVLIELDIHSVMNMGQLTTLLNLKKSTVSRLIGQLITRRICEMQRDKNDRRNKLISLTKKGKRIIAKINAEINAQMQSALDLIDETERDSIVRGISTYAQALKISRLKTE